MIQTLAKNWYLLAVSGILSALSSVIYLLMYNSGPDSPLLPGWHAQVILLGRLLLVAGVCAIAAASWRPLNNVAWLLVLNGIALSAYGLLPLVYKGPLSFRVFALLVFFMATSFGLLILLIARTMGHQRHGLDQTLFGFTGAASVVIACPFLALANSWIQLEPRPFHPSLFLWFCLFFAFSAIAMFGLALRLRGLRPSQSDASVAMPLGTPRHAH
jgi:uncharacterized membrane protein HdeD (DUF308 family)